MICEYCRKEIDKTRGKLLVKLDGTRFYFCSSKCEKNFAKRRKLKYAVK